MFSPLPAETGTDSGRLCTDESVVPIILRQQKIGNMKTSVHRSGYTFYMVKSAEKIVIFAKSL